MFYPKELGTSQTKEDYLENHLDSSLEGSLESYLDDCSLLPGSNKDIVTTDSMVQDVHFCLDWSSPEDLAIKLFQVNLSDMAASGGIPKWCLINLGVPKGDIYKTHENHSGIEEGAPIFLERFSETLKQECWRNNCHLIGGDTFRSGLLFLSLTMGGNVERYISRKDGQDGDHLYLTGNLGLSLAGLRCLNGQLDFDVNTNSYINSIEKHLQPQARMDWAKTIWKMPEVHAMADVSDGLLSNGIQLAKASNLEISIQLDKILVAPELEGKLTPQEAIVSGEELELLFLAEPNLTFPFPCHSIGEARKTNASETGVKLLLKGKNIPFPTGRYTHF